MQTAAPTPPARRCACSPLGLAGCAVGPAYERPDARRRRPRSRKRRGRRDWVPAAPADTLERGPWWQLFDDPVLDALAARGRGRRTRTWPPRSPRTRRRARWSREQRAALFPRRRPGRAAPTAAAARGGARGAAAARYASPHRSAAAGSPTSGAALRARRRERARRRAGERRRPRRGAPVGAGRAGDQLLRAARGRRRDRAAGSARSRATSARCRSRRTATTPASSPRTDVLQAQTQLANARADAGGAARQRARFEHAIAVLVGKAPADFALAAGAVERARAGGAARRAVDAAAAPARHRRGRAPAWPPANAQIGIARSAYFPEPRPERRRSARRPRASATCSARRARSGRSALSLAQTIFDAGATRARVDRRRGGARRRRRALPPDRADRLPGRRGPARATRACWPSSTRCAAQASDAADLIEQQILNRYHAGQVSYTEVVTAQASALNARRALVQSRSTARSSAVALIQALGGGWDATAPVQIGSSVRADNPP